MSQSEVLFRLTVGEEDYMSRWARRNGIDKFDQEWNGSNTKTHPFLGNGPKSMKRTFALILAALAAAALFGGGLCMPCWWPRTFPSQPPLRFTASLPGDSGPQRSLCWRWSAWSSGGWLWPGPAASR